MKKLRFSRCVGIALHGVFVFHPTPGGASPLGGCGEKQGRRNIKRLSEQKGNGEHEKTDGVLASGDTSPVADSLRRGVKTPPGMPP